MPSLSTAARQCVHGARSTARTKNAEVAAYVKSKAKTASEEELDALVTEYAYALSFFDRWKERGVRTVLQLEARQSSRSS